MSSRRRLAAAAWIALSSLAIYLLVRLVTQDSVLAGLLVSANCAINLTEPLLDRIQGEPAAVRASSGAARAGASEQESAPGASPNK